MELYRNTGEPLNRSDFEAKIKQERESRSTNQDDRKALSGKGKTFDEPLMAALAEREEANMNGAMTVFYIPPFFLPTFIADLPSFSLFYISVI